MTSSVERTSTPSRFSLQRGVLTDDETNFLENTLQFFSPPDTRKNKGIRAYEANILFQFRKTDASINFANTLDLFLKYLVTISGGVYGTTAIAIQIDHAMLYHKLCLYDVLSSEKVTGAAIRDFFVRCADMEKDDIPTGQFELDIEVLNTF